MAANMPPRGEERRVTRVGGAAIDGAPIAYVTVLAAVIAVLSFVPIPVSSVLGLGGTFPLSQAIYPLVGFLLGPWAGAVAAGVGRVIGVFIAPHTASSGLLSAVVAAVTAWAGGILVQRRNSTWLFPAMMALFLVAFVAYVGRGMALGVGMALALGSTFVNWLSLFLWILPTRALARDGIASEEPANLAIGLALGSWITNTSSYLVANALFYNLLFQWPAIQWQALTIVAPLEHAFRVVVGTVIGVGVIMGLRAVGLVKPARAGY